MCRSEPGNCRGGDCHSLRNIQDQRQAELRSSCPKELVIAEPIGEQANTAELAGGVPLFQIGGGDRAGRVDQADGGKRGGATGDDRCEVGIVVFPQVLA